MNTLHKVSLITTLSFILPFSAFAADPTAITLGTAGNYTILAKTGISTTGTTAVTGKVGLSPAAASYITGFALTLPVAGAFSTSALITGNVYAPDYADPTPAILTTAVLDMQTAYTDAAGRAPSVTELGTGNIGGLTLAPGVYKWSTGVTVPTDVTLSGSAQDIWIFQIAQNLSVSSGVHINLASGAQASNIFWQVAGQTTIGTTAVFNGNILDQTAIVLNTGATLNGRALAQTAVTLDSNTVTAPSASSVPTPTPVIPVKPATSATPAVPTVNPAIPAIPATPAQTQIARGQAVTLGNGNITYVRADGTFTNAGGQPISNTAVSTSVTITDPPSVFGMQVRAIAVNLTTGNKNNNVATLQQFLISQNKGPAALALARVGATAYFGEMTRAALAEFQASVGISPALGNFGSITRAYVGSY